MRWMMIALLLLSGVACTRARDGLQCMRGTLGKADALDACTRGIEAAASDGNRTAETVFLMQRAAHEMAIGRIDAALADADRAVALDPGGAHVHDVHGLVSIEAGHVEVALRDFGRAIEIDPDHASAYAHRGKLIAGMGRHREAMRDYDRAIDLGTDDWEAYFGRCWIRAVLNEDLEGGLSDCRRAREMKPGAWRPLNGLALIHYRMKHHAQSIDACTLAIAKNPNMATPYFLRGLSRRALGDNAAAAVDIEMAKRIEPGIVARYAGYGIADTPPASR
jgi:tetratricopeptide (TPR) repeat protein